MKKKRELHRLEKESLTRCEKQAEEVLRQCAFLRLNGDGDQIRFGFIHLEAHKLELEARKAWSRYKRWSEEARKRGSTT